MSNAVKQMPGHVEVAYKEVVNNIFFIKRQQWVTTNYTILVYAAIFIISARFFTRTDLARGWLGLLTFLTFFLPPVHDQAISRCDYILSGSTRLDLQNLFQCRRAGWLEFVVAAGSLVASSCHAARAYRSLHGRSCLDFDLLVSHQAVAEALHIELANVASPVGGFGLLRADYLPTFLSE